LGRCFIKLYEGNKCQLILIDWSISNKKYRSLNVIYGNN
jgi:hypothetical protein